MSSEHQQDEKSFTSETGTASYSMISAPLQNTAQLLLMYDCDKDFIGLLSSENPGCSHSPLLFGAEHNVDICSFRFFHFQFSLGKGSTMPTTTNL